MFIIIFVIHLMVISVEVLKHIQVRCSITVKNRFVLGFFFLSIRLKTDLKKNQFGPVYQNICRIHEQLVGWAQQQEKL